MSDYETLFFWGKAGIFWGKPEWFWCITRPVMDPVGPLGPLALLDPLGPLGPLALKWFFKSPQWALDLPPAGISVPILDMSLDCLTYLVIFGQVGDQPTSP